MFTPIPISVVQNINTKQKDETIQANKISNYSSIGINDRTRNLKKPNNWENFWYDVCIVNEMHTSDFNTSAMLQNLNLIRNYYNINDNDISNKYGNLSHSDPEIVDQQLEKINEMEFHNNSDQEQAWTTDSWSKEISKSTKWHITAEVGTKITINFIFNSWEISLKLSGGYEETTVTTENITFASQNLKVKPNSTGTFQWLLWNTIYDLKGNLEYGMSWNDSQFLDLVYSNGSHVKVNIGWTLWAIANRGIEEYFTKDSEDLFIWNNDSKEDERSGKMTFNVPMNWQVQGYKAEYEYNN